MYIYEYGFYWTTLYIYIRHVSLSNPLVGWGGNTLPYIPIRNASSFLPSPLGALIGGSPQIFTSRTAGGLYSWLTNETSQ